ncbi:MAG TPA: helix-turn-helix domain-containing protein [Candidatus Hydrogenedentes bacterium]|nr:MAG: DNA-binding transcriptional regulator DhaR [Candidatus Hydrogenedentes bacterium ADurb.Bin170]HNZ47256.1 helix-turn-helix domain-containing protein [Candidatus Hydrogenedentota bacterium]HOD94484.1 helix-turn-helix domain-containing protein [Candidatus Hydrogenedentota bacterium]HOM48238.1 helix-turn-helix domain-containing protein [Candidatus Hydrogenedentota bacterium]HOR49860.1 helix-turn-helix domain-containing protein [Candidatus Hydrogenedentota bacterium]
MACVLLNITSVPLRITLEVMLHLEGHTLSEIAGDAAVTDSLPHAADLAGQYPVLLLVPAAQVADAVGLMRKGVHDYALLPLQPGEVPFKIERILASLSAPAHDGVIETGQELKSLAAMEEAHIRLALRHCKGNQLQAAKLLGIGRNTLWRKLRRYAAQQSDDR